MYCFNIVSCLLSCSLCVSDLMPSSSIAPLEMTSVAISHFLNCLLSEVRDSKESKEEVSQRHKEGRFYRLGGGG